MGATSEEFWEADYDPVDPQHYKRNGLETIDVIEAFFMHSPHLANVFRYISRAGKKPGNPAVQDIDKAIAYLKRYKNLLNGEKSWE